ncbi:MAG: alpha/beta hydrolase [Pseudomonadota bacterium]
MDTGIDYEAEYNNRARVPDHGDIMRSWTRDAAKWRTDADNARLDISYGDTPRQALDIFKPRKEKPGPIALFIHGGYWQALGRESFSHMARGPNAHGLTVAVASYDLCPNVTVDEIIGQMRSCCLYLWRTYKRRIVVYGHSAGGHLTAALLATHWQEIDPSVPPLLVSGGLSISGLFDLVPLVHTSVNDKLRMTEEDAENASPILWSPPSGLKMIAAVGAAESSEYLRQSHDIAHTWHEDGMAVIPLELDGHNHFTVISGLADPDSLLTHSVVGLASSAT